MTPARPSKCALCSPRHHQFAIPDCYSKLMAAFPWSRPAVIGTVVYTRVEEMILPDAVDTQIFAGIALPHKTGLFQKLDRPAIAGNAGGFEAVQPQAGKSKRYHRTHRRRHVAVAHERQTSPVAKASGLGDPAPDIGQGQAAD